MELGFLGLNLVGSGWVVFNGDGEVKLVWV